MSSTSSYRTPANKPGIDIPPNKNTKSVPSCLPLAPDVRDGIGAIDVWVGDDGLATTDNEPLTGEEVVATIVGAAVGAARWSSMDQSASNQAHALELTGGASRTALVLQLAVTVEHLERRRHGGRRSRSTLLGDGLADEGREMRRARSAKAVV